MPIRDDLRDDLSDGPQLGSPRDDLRGEPRLGGRSPIDREILDIIPERFDSDADSQYARKGAHTRIILTVALALLAVAALGVAARHIFFGEQVKTASNGGIPVIKADDRPIKTKPGPDDRGGMEVPNQDKRVYDRMGSAGEAEPQRESLLPPPEQPQAPAQQPRQPSIKPAFQAPPVKEGGAAPLVQPPATQSAPAPQAAQPPAPTPAPQPQVTAQAPLSAPATPTPQPAKPAPVAPSTKAAPAPAPVAKAAPAPAPAAAPRASAGGGWVVQLAAVKTEAEARNEWNRIRGAHKDTLGSLSSDIVRVDLGAKGIFWRLRAGPLEEAQARTICAALSKSGQGCILAKK